MDIYRENQYLFIKKNIFNNIQLLHKFIQNQSLQYIEENEYFKLKCTSFYHKKLKKWTWDTFFDINNIKTNVTIQDFLQYKESLSHMNCWYTNELHHKKMTEQCIFFPIDLQKLFLHFDDTCQDLQQYLDNCFKKNEYLFYKLTSVSAKDIMDIVVINNKNAAKIILKTIKRSKRCMYSMRRNKRIQLLNPLYITIRPYNGEYETLFEYRCFVYNNKITKISDISDDNYQIQTNILHFFENFKRISNIQLSQYTMDIVIGDHVEVIECNDFGELSTTDNYGFKWSDLKTELVIDHLLEELEFEDNINNDTCFHATENSIRIQYCSDLHIEHNTNYNFSIDPNAQILIVAGDIITCSPLERMIHFLNLISKYYEFIIIVPGNHEYYGRFLNETFQQIEEEIENVIVLQCSSIIVQINDINVRILGCTLWTGILYPSAYYMNDYNYIVYSNENSIGNTIEKLSIDHVINEHAEHIIWLYDELNYILNQKEKNVIIVTHHAPSYQSLDSSRDKGLYCAYATENLLENMYDYFEHKINNTIYWIHGHVHQTLDYNVGEFNVLCNPLGYDGENQNHCTKFIEYSKT